MGHKIQNNFIVAQWNIPPALANPVPVLKKFPASRLSVSIKLWYNITQIRGGGVCKAL